MPTYKLPNPNEINESLEMVLGEPAKIVESDPLALTATSHAAEFTNHDGKVVAYCLVDLPLAAGLGAALSMVPPAAAEDMVAEGQLTEMARANLHEVMNIFSQMYMDDSTAHLKLSAVKAANDSQLDAIEGGTQEVSFELDTGRYGKGHLRFISA